MLRDELQEIVDDFTESPRDMRMELLLDYADGLPKLPERYATGQRPLERIRECQTPFGVAIELEHNVVRLFFDAPPQAPTTRGYAGILAAGLDGASPEEIAATPPDVYSRMLLDELITPLRLRGMSAILASVHRQVAQAQASAG